MEILTDIIKVFLGNGQDYGISEEELEELVYSLILLLLITYYLLQFLFLQLLLL